MEKLRFVSLLTSLPNSLCTPRKKPQNQGAEETSKDRADCKAAGAHTHPCNKSNIDWVSHLLFNRKYISSTYPSIVKVPLQCPFDTRGYRN